MLKKIRQPQSDIEYLLPRKIVLSDGVYDCEKLLCSKEMCVSFKTDNAYSKIRGAKIVFDFGREICGGVRIFTRYAGEKGAKIRLSFGESLGEALSELDYKNSTNDHSPRDFEGVIATLSDLSFGQTAFRFVLLEVLDDCPVNIQNIFAFCKTDKVKSIGSIVTNDLQINKILKTAQYTLKLNMQNGYIWDGAKRDRLVWSGDLHQESVTSFYCFGKTPNVYNSLKFLKKQYPVSEWINGIATYSAWWVIDLCDYLRFCGTTPEFSDDAGYAKEIIKKINDCIDENGNMSFGENKDMEFFLDWPSQSSEERIVGAASVYIIAAKKYNAVFGGNEYTDAICRKLGCYLEADTVKKQVRAMQVLAGRKNPNDCELLQKDGAAGFSTFMAYYILSAMIQSGSTVTPQIIKEYFGGMLNVGATTFFEDFDLSWSDGSCRIDALPKEGEKDIHGDYGKYCYKGYRHSLCHGWASGVYAFFLERIIGLTVLDGFKSINICPASCGIKKISATVPSPYGKIKIYIENGVPKVFAPKEIKVNIISG